MARRMFSGQIGTKKSICIPLIVTLVTLVATGFLIISYFNDFYRTEKAHEATLLAQTYANTLESALDARALLVEQLHTTLRVAGNIASRQTGPFTNEMLANLASILNVDVLYVYNSAMEIEYSSDNLYIGWVPPKGHPVRTFFESGHDHYVDEIRTDSETDTYWLYSYQRYADGRMIQTGILADKLAELYEKLNEQWIIDQIAKESPLLQIAFINGENIITASNIPEEIGQSVDEATLAGSGDRDVNHPRFDRKGFAWHLKLYTPIWVNATKVGTLALLFDFTNTNRLFVRIALTTTAVLMVLFILFTFSIFFIARKNRSIFTVAYYDDITGLPNIKYLKRVLKEQEHRKLALLIINPLYFSYINLIYGYSYGDILLRQIAQAVNSIAVQGVQLHAYRFTDDQFILTAENYESAETLDLLCQHILSINNEPGALGLADLSIGVVQWHKKTLDFDTIIKEASIALSATNRSNRIQYYTKEIEENLLRQDTIENELKRIIAGEEGILHLVYQPIVDSKDRSIVSFEALARMQSSILGNVPPLEFIAIAEERQLIIPLGKVILEHAAAFSNRLSELHIKTYPIAVNVSAMQLLEESFVENFQDIAMKAGIDVRDLEIELTESVFSHDFEFLSQQIQAIHALGIRIAIDDFGTGFSSLNLLEGLVVDVLKLDKLFVDRLSDPMTKGISSDIISMAHHLEKHIIAEGVETESQRQLLLDMGCDYLQGYLFSRPVEEKDVIRLVQEDTRQSPHHE